MFKFTPVLLRNSRNSLILCNLVRLNNFSTATTVELKNIADNGDVTSTSSAHANAKVIKSRNSMVAAAFASLQSTVSNDIKTPFTDSKVSSATTIDELLSISEGSGISRNHALKVVSILADWSLKGKVKLSDFESDPRFIKLCRVLTRSTFGSRNHRNTVSRSEDLSTILSVTADDEAAKLVASITMPQMVKVMTTLCQKKRRSTMLLRALSYNITRNSEQLDLKQCGDLLYSMAVLNFPDENLLERLSIDVCKGLDDKLKKSSVVGSILTSLGLLKYKEPGVLDALCEWIVEFYNICRPQDVFALFLTLAVLNYEPSNCDSMYKVLIPQLTISDAGKPTEWLDMVWSLVLLNRAESGHISSVLSEEFIKKIEEGNSLSISSKLKLLNIDSAVQYLMLNYVGERLDLSSPIRNVEISRSKEKEEIGMAIADSLKSLVSVPNMNTRINTGMGFYIEAECILDRKCNPVSADKYTGSPDQIRIAIVSLDYHDMCKGREEPTGVNILSTKLLEAKGYKVLTIPYMDFKPKDKLVRRVQYLESRLKALVQT